MKNLFIKPTPKTPEINFDINSGELLISGVSVPENAVKFFTPVVEWLRNYAKTPSEITTLTFKLEYINTSSLQFLYDVLKELDEILAPPIVVVNWCHTEEDEDMKETGEDFREATNSLFKFIVINEI